MNEIGSDFFTVEKNKELFLSGRTAEDFLIRDMLEEKKITSALLPSFCCHTMIEPFLRNDISVRFYDVFFENGLKAELPQKKSNEAILFLKYFGYKSIRGIENVSEWDVTIEDCTHSWLSGSESVADYSFISYRKWTGFSAVASVSKRGYFKTTTHNLQNEKYELLRDEAMTLKADYISGKIKDKDIYLKKFRKAEELLEDDYINYRPANKTVVSLASADWDFIKRKRKENARVLLDLINDIDEIHPMFPEIDNGDVPLCVPVLVSPQHRDGLRKYLIDNSIYCPIHWPLSDMHRISEIAKQIYEQELSLICDQRYDQNDMVKEADTIRSFFV